MGQGGICPACGSQRSNDGTCSTCLIRALPRDMAFASPPCTPHAPAGSRTRSVWERSTITLPDVPTHIWEDAQARADEDRVPLSVWVTNVVRKACS